MNINEVACHICNVLYVYALYIGQGFTWSAPHGC